MSDVLEDRDLVFCNLVNNVNINLYEYSTNGEIEKYKKIKEICEQNQIDMAVLFGPFMSWPGYSYESDIIESFLQRDNIDRKSSCFK